MNELPYLGSDPTCVVRDDGDDHDDHEDDDHCRRSRRRRCRCRRRPSQVGSEPQRQNEITQDVIYIFMCIYIY